jgi:hypothetical protein
VNGDDILRRLNHGIGERIGKLLQWTGGRGF